MTKEEALHKLEFMRNAYQKLIDENVDEGRFVGTDIAGTWKADTSLNEAYREHVEALDMAISAMKKQEEEELVALYYAVKNGVKVASWEPLISTYNAKREQSDS